MKQHFRILLLILFSLIPFGFLAMYWDFVGRTIMGYVYGSLLHLSVAFWLNDGFRGNWFFLFHCRQCSYPMCFYGYLLILTGIRFSNRLQSRRLWVSFL